MDKFRYGMTNNFKTKDLVFKICKESENTDRDVLLKEIMVVSKGNMNPTRVLELIDQYMNCGNSVRDKVIDMIDYHENIMKVYIDEYKVLYSQLKFNRTLYKPLISEKDEQITRLERKLDSLRELLEL